MTGSAHRGGGSVGEFSTGGYHRLRQRFDFLVRHPTVAVLGNDVDQRVDLAVQVRTTRDGVVVGRVVECLQRNQCSVGLGKVIAVQLLQSPFGVDRTGPDGVVAVLLVAAAHRVVAENAAFSAGRVVAHEQQVHDECLLGKPQGGAVYGGQPVSFAFQRQRAPLALLVVLKFHL